jgi:hypothetical protein
MFRSAKLCKMYLDLIFTQASTKHSCTTTKSGLLLGYYLKTEAPGYKMLLLQSDYNIFKGATLYNIIIPSGCYCKWLRYICNNITA